MSEAALKNYLMIDEESNSLRLTLDSQTINILIYTDNPFINDKEPDSLGLEDGFGLRRMKKLMKDHETAFTKFNIKVLNRNQDGKHASQKLKVAGLLEHYDQVWFFGVDQMNLKGPYNPLQGGPESELGDDEVEELCEWMKTGGVLIAGDHANPDPRSGGGSNPETRCPKGVDHETFVGLGRALGHRVPRAGQLRKWHGPPTACAEDSFNTQVKVGAIGIDNPSLDTDSVPQQLLLEKFDGNWNPNPKGLPHPLFLRKTDSEVQWIQVLPDHTHEGELTIPEGLDEEWPAPVEGRKAKPIIVAYGLDKRFASHHREYPMVVVYDGAPVNVGRIVAASTWHHYFNHNLNDFFGDFSPGSVADQLGQFYANVAWWLTPSEKRKAMGCEMFLRLAMHPLIREEMGAGLLNIGRAADFILSKHAGALEAYELLQEAIPDSLRVNLEMVEFPPLNSETNSLPSRELLLGSLVHQYYQAIVNCTNPELADETLAKTFADLNREGVVQAFGLHAKYMESLAIDARNNFGFCLS
jgi:hypothetical protein